eukprot:gene41133-50183_t
MSIFDAYDSEFAALTKDITKNLSELKNDPQSGSSAIKMIDALLSQTQDLIKQMEVELRSHDAATRKSLTEKVNVYKKTRQNLKSDFERAKEESERSALIGEKSAEHRQRLLNANDKLSRQNEMIMNAHRTVLETEEAGEEILGELGRNREKILSSREKAHEFTGITDTARRLLASMNKRETRQKYTLVFIGVVLVIAIIITIVYSTK